MRKQLAHFFLMASVLIWGTWFGGQFFNWCMIIPKRLSNPPESINAFDIIPTEGDFPFFMLNPFFFLISLTAMLIAWKWAKDSRKWLVLTTFLSFSISIVLIFYLAPLIHSTDYKVNEESLPAQEIIRRVAEWKTGNAIRLLFDFFGFLFSVLALRTWTAEAAAATSDNRINHNDAHIQSESIQKQTSSINN